MADDDTPKHRYNAALANEIERRWQDRWEAEHVFWTPNRTGLLAEDPRGIADRPALFVLDMFPYPSGDGLHVGHPLGYIAHRRVRALPAHERLQRAARDGLRRVRAARRAVRGADRAAPARHDRAEHRNDAAPAARARARPRPAARSGHDRRRVLPLDAVDLPADLQLLVRRRRRPGPADRRARRGVPQPALRPTPDGIPFDDLGAARAARSWSTRTGSRTSPRRR